MNELLNHLPLYEHCDTGDGEISLGPELSGSATNEPRGRTDAIVIYKGKHFTHVGREEGGMVEVYDVVPSSTPIKIRNAK